MAKPRNVPATRKGSAGGFMLGMFVGLIAGLAVANVKVSGTLKGSLLAGYHMISVILRYALARL